LEQFCQKTEQPRFWRCQAGASGHFLIGGKPGTENPKAVSENCHKSLNQRAVEKFG
jgi:hypothetical protein